MGLERRNGRLYYYRKVRVDGRVCSEYGGSGFLALLCAEQDEAERQDRAAERAAQQATRQAEARIDKQLAGVESALTAVTHTALCAAGFHNHKGQWRKRRHASR